MKENVLDVLMYLFQNYMDSEAEAQPTKESLEVELTEVGFHHAEIGKAFDWLEGLAMLQQSEPRQLPVTNSSIRIFTLQEKEKLDTECRGFLLFLEQVGVLDSMTRELVIDRVMALEVEDFDLEQLKWVILMVLSHQPGQEAAYAWMEDLVFDEIGDLLH
jgi:Smg protein